VLGARLISVTGLLQNESGVIHVVADHLEDLSGLLRHLHEQAPAVDTLMRCDEVKRPDPGIRSAKHQHQREVARRKEEAAVPEPYRPRHPRAGDALVTSLKKKPDLFDVSQAAAVLPKGRNFH